jgi:hypothetical protein
MNGYAKVEPTFWIGETGKKLRREGVEAQLVALYLLTNPHANPIGLYYCPIMFIAHETGLGIKGASKGLQRAFDGGFCAYDEASEMVWVYEMARYQIADALKQGDNRTKWIQAEYDALPENPFLRPFFDKYQQAFHMRSARLQDEPERSPLEGPSKPPSPSTTPTTAPKQKGAGALDLSSLPESLSEALWEEFVKHRKTIKKPLTQEAVNRIGNELHRIEAAGIAPNEALGETLERGWVSIKRTWLENTHENGTRSRANGNGASRAKRVADTLDGIIRDGLPEERTERVGGGDLPAAAGDLRRTLDGEYRRH